jgi:hypothetical protein
LEAGLALRGPFSGLDGLLQNESGPIEMRLSDWRGRTRGSVMPARVLSKKARMPPGRCELMDEWLRWCGRWALVEPAMEEGSAREALDDEGLDGDLVREGVVRSRIGGGGLVGISGNGDERDDLDVAAI